MPRRNRKELILLGLDSSPARLTLLTRSGYIKAEPKRIPSEKTVVTGPESTPIYHSRLYCQTLRSISTFLFRMNSALTCRLTLTEMFKTRNYRERKGSRENPGRPCRPEKRTYWGKFRKTSDNEKGPSTSRRKIGSGSSSDFTCDDKHS